MACGMGENTVFSPNQTCQNTLYTLSNPDNAPWRGTRTPFYKLWNWGAGPGVFSLSACPGLIFLMKWQSQDSEKSQARSPSSTFCICFPVQGRIKALHPGFKTAEWVNAIVLQFYRYKERKRKRMWLVYILDSLVGFNQAGSQAKSNANKENNKIKSGSYPF